MSAHLKIGAMLDGGPYMAPDQWDDLAWGFQRAYEFAVRDPEGLPESVTSNLLRFAADAQLLLEQVQRFRALAPAGKWRKFGR